MSARQILAILCAVAACVIAFLVMVDAGAVADDGLKWVAGAVFIVGVGLGVLAAP